MLGGKVFSTLLSYLTDGIEGFGDPRVGKNKHFSMRDVALSAFATFFCQSPSFLAFQRLMRQAHGVDNAQTVFGVGQLPTDNQIRNVLDEVDPEGLREVYRRSLEYLQQRGVIGSFRSFANTLLVALDGTGYFYSEKINCPLCSVAHHREGRVSYSHSVVMAAVVKPDCAQVLAMEPQFIFPQKGRDRQDCELEAAKRWIGTVGPLYGPLAITLLGDALYCCQPLIELVQEQEMDYIFAVKPKAQKYLYQELDSLGALGEIHHLQRTRWTGKRQQSLAYRYLNDVQLRDGQDSVRVNWVELTITNDAAKVIRRFNFATSHLISEENVEALVEAGRCRWKIENEDFNTLKTKGYHFEHNFGHGKRYLSQTLLSLNILAFLFHTVLELLDDNCSRLRGSLPRRETFFQHISTLTHYLCFAGWESLLMFMIKALEEGPRPPPPPGTVIE